MVLLFAMVLGAISTMGADMSVQTKVFDKESQPMLVGGYIENYSKQKVSKKGIIVSKNADDLIITDDAVFDKATMFLQGKESGRINNPYDLRFIDCTDTSEEQFACTLQFLIGNTDYYVKAYVIDTDKNVLYGSTEKVHTQDFNRYDGWADYANVWYAFSNTLFDVVTDEIINPSDGFYYSTNENPKTVRHQVGTSYNTCYKFATEWNYKLWYSQWYYGTIENNSSLVVHLPIMKYHNGQLTIEKSPIDADKNITIYYSINGNYFRPETYTEIYTNPLVISEPCAVYCYAISSDGYISYTNVYVVGDYTINENIDDDSISLKGQGTWDNPYLIGTATELEMFNELLAIDNSICGKLTANIVLNENVLDKNYNLNNDGKNFKQWTPHGIDKGYFNGAGHTISGLYINNNKEYQALFESASLIDSLGVIDSYIKAYRHAGGLCSWLRNGEKTGGQISNCFFDGVVIATSDKAGGISAHMGNTYDGGQLNRIINSYNKGIISGYNHVGGICGSAYSLTYFDDDIIENCYNVGSISATWTDCGAICGYVNKVEGTKVSGTASKCYSLENSCNKSGQGYDGELKIYEDFNNGSVCALLNSNGGCYHQTVGIDEYPILFDPNIVNEDDSIGKVAEAVHLGLSIKWASWNVGANAPEDDGYLFAWGELAPKEDYSASTYKFYDNGYTKYGSVDNKYTLDQEDDAAYQLWGNKWRMPTIEELTELKEKCDFSLTELNGASVTKVTGPNGNYIYFPFPGNFTGDYLYFHGSVGSYWSSTLDTDSYAQDLDFFSSSQSLNGDTRHHGQSIRPVYIGTTSNDDGSIGSGIKTINNNDSSKRIIFNIEGQRIQFMQKGINIINGKKVIVK